VSYDNWDGAIDAARDAGGAVGHVIAGWADLPSGDAEQLLHEAASAYLGAALTALRTARLGAEGG
jgi:hypothetical protein